MWRSGPGWHRRQGGQAYQDGDLLRSLREVATRLGKSPSARDLVQLSKENVCASQATYTVRFGSINKALMLAGLTPNRASRGHAQKPRRHTHPRQRFRIFLRDEFRCVYCGATPSDGVRLTIDHVFPYSAGGQTNDENLKTACVDCNLGKHGMVLDLEKMVGS